MMTSRPSGALSQSSSGRRELATDDPMDDERTTRLPTGTVTFLFSDIQGSTRLVQQLGDRYPAVLDRHHAILREAFEKHGGIEVGTAGDSFFVVFPTPSGAVAAALDGDRGLIAHAWSNDETIHVRMGIHTGEGAIGAGSYVGVDVHRAARIAAAAHGGQIVLSDATRALVENHLPEDASLSDLGAHRLKDLLEPEHLFQLEHPALKRDFPPLRSLSSRPNNLPTQSSPLFGRAEELRAVTSAFLDEGARLVTLTGPGGIGKTRLALQAAADLADRFDHGVYFVDLSPVRDAADAFEAIIGVLNEPRAPEIPPLEELKRSLENRHVGLLLDNLEQVIEIGNGLVKLLASCPSVHILATSREALRVRGERALAVPPLDLPADARGSSEALAASDAVRLFLERARESGAAFEVNDDALSAIADICIRLDGLPLAIELAAARLHLFDVAELRNRLRDRIDALGSGARDLPERQRTLRSTIEWSYELLQTDERDLFAVMSLFPSARSEDVERVVAEVETMSEVDVLDTLASLIAKSLVQSVDARGGRRFTMLGTIREYARERLRARPLGTVAERAHAEYFATFAANFRDAARGSGREDALSRLEEELGNLMTAWRYWVAHGRFDRLDGMLDALWILHDTRGWYQGALELTSGLLGALERIPSSAERAREELTVRTSLARGLMAIRGYTKEVQDAYERALALVDEAGGLPDRIPVLRSLASLYLYRGEFDRCNAVGRQLLRIAEEHGDESIEAEGHLRVGTSLISLGHTASGLEHLERAAAMFDPDRHGTDRFRLGPSAGVTPHTTTAFVLWLTGSPDRAHERAQVALATAERLGQPYTLAYARFHVALLHLWERDWRCVRDLAGSVLAIAEAHEYQVWRATALVLDGAAMAALGAVDDGLAASDRGIELYREMLAPPVFWPLLLGIRARTFGYAGRPGDGLDALEKAKQVLGSDERAVNVLYPQFPLVEGDLLATAGDDVRAEAAYRRALETAREVGARMNELQAATRLARMAPGDDGATNRLRRLYETFGEGLDVPDLVDARVLLASA